MHVLLIGRGANRFRDSLLESNVDGEDRVAAAEDLPSKDVAAHLKACDLVVQPYPDGVSTRRSTAMAGLACGVPTVTNLGAHGIDAFTPVLNPPQSAILGVGRIAQRAVVEDGRLVAAPTCVLSLTFDHRVTDGAPAADLLAAVARRMNEKRS